MKKWITLILILCLFAIKVNGQTYTQTFIDKCTGEKKIATTTMINGSATVSFYNEVRTFSPLEVQTGQLQIWINQVYLRYSVLVCPTNVVVQQTVTAAVSQAAAQAASSAAASAASSAASSSTSAAASSSAAAASSAPPPTASAPPPASSSSQSSGSSSSSSSQSEGGSSSGGSSSESKTETKSETKSESKSEESKSESKTEEKKEESKSESKEEKKEDKKESKKEEKKRSGNLNPMLVASDYSVVETPDRQFGSILGLGWSRSSMAGDESFSANAMIWSNLKQFALGGGYTKMEFNDGKLDAIHSYGVTAAYLDGNYMALVGYTWIKPHPKFGTFGYNIGLVNLFLKGTELKYDYSMSISAVTFWTKPYQYSKKLTISPQVFLMSSPLAFNTFTGNSAVGRHAGFLLGSSFDYKISKRFGFSFNYKLNSSTQPNTPILHMFLVGSRLIL